eukprot:808252-Pleurochrysis_carterae.AAC.1
MEAELAAEAPVAMEAEEQPAEAEECVEVEVFGVRGVFSVTRGATPAAASRGRGGARNNNNKHDGAYDGAYDSVCAEAPPSGYSLGSIRIYSGEALQQREAQHAEVRRAHARARERERETCSSGQPESVSSSQA